MDTVTEEATAASILAKYENFDSSQDARDSPELSAAKKLELAQLLESEFSSDLRGSDSAYHQLKELITPENSPDSEGPSAFIGSASTQQPQSEQTPEQLPSARMIKCTALVNRQEELSGRLSELLTNFQRAHRDVDLIQCLYKQPRTVYCGSGTRKSHLPRRDSETSRFLKRWIDRSDS